MARRTLWWVALGVALYAAGAAAHLCNNIYRTPDRVIVKPEKQVTALDRDDEFRVFVQNNYPTLLHNIRLTATVEGGGVAVTVTPQSVQELKAAERTAFTVRLTVQPGAARGRRQLQFGVSTNEVGFRAVQEATN